MSVWPRGRTQWLVLVVVALVAGAAVVVRVASTGRASVLVPAATVDMRALEHRGALAPAYRVEPSGEAAAESQEKAEPNLPVASPVRVSHAAVSRAFVSVVPSPFPAASFLGQPDVPQLGMTKTESPPDTSGAVGRDKLMITLNNNYVIERKSDGAVLSTVSISSFWSAVGADDPFDPRVEYDPYSDRWLVSAGDDPLLGSSKLMYGISDTGDPQGAWRLYAVDSDPTKATWADFPTLGFSRDTVAIGANMFTIGGFTYVRGRLMVLDYASLRAGGSGNPVQLTVPDGFALQPAVTYSPTEKTLYIVEHVDSNAGTYRLWALNGTNLTLVGGAARTNPLGPWTTPGPGNSLPQEHGAGVDSGDARIGNAVFRNGHIYYAQTIGLPPGGVLGGIVRSAVQWVELDPNGNFVQGGRIDDSGANPWNGGHSYAFGSLAVNARGDVLVGFSEFQSDDFIDAGYAYRAADDPPGTLRTPVTFKDGEGSYTKERGGRNRWGDYSTTTVDPSDDLSLWTLQEYAATPTGKGIRSGRWGVWWARVGGGVPQVHEECANPRLIGKTRTAARQILAASKCRIGAVRFLNWKPRYKGKVVKQQPEEGTTLDAGSRVNVWLGKIAR